MAINDIVSGTWEDVRLLNRLNEKLRRPITRRELLGRGAKGLAALIAANYLVNRARADDPPQSNGITYDVDNSMTCERINQIITEANGGDKDPNDPTLRDIIHFQPGTYNLRILGPSRWEYYNFLPNRNYLFNLEGVTIWGRDRIEHVDLIEIGNGGNMNIAGNLTAGNSRKGIWIGFVPFKNIDIRGINFTNVYEYCMVYQDREHASPLSEPAVKISYCTADGGDKFVKCGWIGGASANSPYPRVENCTVSNLRDWGVDLPSWRVVTGATAGSDYTKIVLGQNDININVWVNCDALADPRLYEYFSSPKRNRYLDVNQPFYGDEEDDNKDVSANDFYENTLYPIMFGGAHLGNGKSAGAHPLVATMQSLQYFVERYLSTPDSPNWDQRVDFDNDGVVTLKDFAELANRWYRAESGLIAKTIPFIDKSIMEKALAGEPNYRRLLGDIRRAA